MTGSIADAVSALDTSLAPLHQTAMTATDYWNDSCSIEELTYAIERGAVGATSNPTIVGEVLGKEMPLWRERIGQIIAEHPTWAEDEVAWQLIEEMAVRASELLLPVFEREGGLKGRLSIQTNPKLYRSAERLVEQAKRFAGLAPNMQVKIPATRAGIDASRSWPSATASWSIPASCTGPELPASSAPTPCSASVATGPACSLRPTAFRGCGHGDVLAGSPIRGDLQAHLAAARLA